MPCDPAGTHYTVPGHFLPATSLVSQNNLQFIQCLTFKEGEKSKRLPVMTLIGVICENNDSEGTIWHQLQTIMRGKIFSIS